MREPLRFRHRLTTPSGRAVALNELTNHDYLVLVKTLAQDGEGAAFELWDSLIEESVSDFRSLDLVERLYVYVAYVYFNIRTQVQLKDTLMGDVAVSLERVLANIEESYQASPPEELVVELNENVELVFAAPCSFSVSRVDEDSRYEVDFFSGLKNLRRKNPQQDVVLTDEQRSRLLESLPGATVLLIEESLREHFHLSCPLFKGVEGTREEEVELFSPAGLMFAAAVLGEPVEAYYQYAYVFAQYLHISWSDYNAMSPVEAQVLFAAFEEDKRKQREEQQKAAENASVPSLPKLGPQPPR